MLAREKRIHWIVESRPKTAYPNVTLMDSLPEWSFGDVLASVDALIGKLGTASAWQQLTKEIPFIMVPRGTFADEPPIMNWLQKHARVMEVAASKLPDINLWESVTKLIRSSIPTRPTLDGDVQAAHILLELLDELK